MQNPESSVFGRKSSAQIPSVAFPFWNMGFHRDVPGTWDLFFFRSLSSNVHPGFIDLFVHEADSLPKADMGSSQMGGFLVS